MKRTFTLLFTLCILSGASVAKAQSVYVSYHPTAKPLYVTAKMYRYNNAYSITRQERDAQIFRINQQYNASVKSVFSMRFVSANEKLSLIRSMEAKKDAQIKAVNIRFNDSRNKYNNAYYDRNYNWIGR